MPFRPTRRALLLGAATTLLSTQAPAQQLGGRPVRILVGFSAGGATDVLARLYAQELQTLLNTPVLVDNRPGASQLVAIHAMTSAPPDGHTLFLGTASSLASGPAVFTDLPYDPVKDFSHIAMIATAPGVFFVNPALPIHSMRELIDYAKAHPGTLNYGSAGVGSSNHLQTEYLKGATKIDLTHVPYKSDQEVAREVAAGTLQFALTVAQAGVPLIEAGKLRAIGVTGSQRLKSLPDTSSLAESGVPALAGIDSYTFYGLVGPAGMPAELVTALNEAVNKVSAQPQVAERMRETMNFYPERWSPAKFRRYIEGEMPKWREVGKAMKMSEKRS
jgi:tripartite-type tricarboxylate transporter receptor subunit TctC